MHTVKQPLRVLVTFIGAKGGVATTTVATLAALSLRVDVSAAQLHLSPFTTVEDTGSMLGVDRTPTAGHIVRLRSLTLANSRALASTMWLTPAQISPPTTMASLT